MKTLIGLILLISTSLSASAIAGKSLPPAYIVLSDSLSNAVPLGFCKVTGFAMNYGNPVVNGKISTLNGNYSTVTDSSGHYELLISSKDTSLFFFKSQLSEVVIWSYDFKSRHDVTINFNAGVDYGMMSVDKPVIYLYSEKDISATLELDFKGELEFTYPSYESGWNVEVSSEGIKSKGESYPYLFWEGKMADVNFMKADDRLVGDLVGKSDVVSFLSEKLDVIGFSSTEKTDFITYWGPKMVQNNFSFVQFLIDEDYDSKIGTVDVNPQPDSKRRVYMLFSSYESNPNLDYIPQTFETFEREGFTLFEWGGSEISVDVINL
jgi:hypothetical protein